MPLFSNHQYLSERFQTILSRSTLLNTKNMHPFETSVESIATNAGFNQLDSDRAIQMLCDEKVASGDLEFSRKNWQLAHTFYEEAYELRRNALGDGHKDTISAAFHVGKCFHCLGKFGCALNYYQKVYKEMKSCPINSKRFTKENIVILQQIAWVLHQDNMFNHARNFYELALRSAKKLFAGSKIVSRILNRFGNLYFEFGQLSSALKCYEECLQIETKALVESSGRINATTGTSNAQLDPDILMTLSNIARTYERVGLYEKSLKCLRKITSLVTRYQTTAGLFVNTDKTCVHMAHLELKLGRPKKALAILTEILVTQRKKHGHEHCLVAATLNEIGIIQGCYGQNHSALVNLEESLRIRKKLHDLDRSRTSTVLFNIASVHINDGDLVTALERLNELVLYELSSLKNRKIHCDQDLNSSSLVVLLNAIDNMAYIYQDGLHEPQKALTCLLKGLHIIKKEGPRGNVPFDVLSRYLGNTGKAYMRQGEHKKGAKFLIKAMRVNVAGGLAVGANIPSISFTYDLHKTDNQHLPSAPAA